MLEKLLSFDTQLFIYLNGLGSETFDPFWLLITKQINWLPFFLLLAYLIIKKLGAKQTLIVLLFIAVLLTITDQTTNLFKNGFQRLRPCNDPSLNTFIRVVKKSYSFSFFSGHAANTMSVATFLYFIFKNKIKYFGVIFIWPLIFAYSRIYLGLHYPIDILTGYFFGFIFGFMMFSIYGLVHRKYFPPSIN